jgi:hypothetical protein
MINMGGVMSTSETFYMRVVFEIFIFFLQPDDGLFIKPKPIAVLYKTHVVFDCHIYSFLVYQYCGMNVRVQLNSVITP